MNGISSLKEEWDEFRKEILSAIQDEAKEYTELKESLRKALFDLQQLAVKSEKMLLAEALMRKMESLEPKFFVPNGFEAK